MQEANALECAASSGPMCLIWPAEQAIDLLLGGQCRVAVHQVPVVRDALGQQITQAFDVVAPVPMQLTSDGEPVHQLCASGAHTGPCGLLDGGVEGAGSISHHEYVEAFGQCGKCRERNARIAGQWRRVCSGGRAGGSTSICPRPPARTYLFSVLPWWLLAPRGGYSMCRPHESSQTSHFQIHFPPATSPSVSA